MKRALLAMLLVGATACESPRIERLRAQMQHPDRSTRIDAADQLGALAPDPIRRPTGTGPAELNAEQREAVRILTQAVANDDDEGVRLAAAWALWAMRPPGPQPELVACALGDTNATTPCFYTLTTSADPANLREIVRALQGPRGQAKSAARGEFHRLGNRAIPYLVDLMRHGDAEAHRTVVEVLCAIGTPEAGAAVAEGLTHRNPRLRGYTAVVLVNECGMLEAFRPQLAALADDPDADVRAFIRDQLGLPPSDLTPHGR